MIDLHSDTQTRPTDATRAVMACAPVGDEQADEDPTTLRLSERVAVLLGMERGVFMLRQSGIVAAAGLHALDRHVERLKDDHAHAQLIWRVLSGCGLFGFDPSPPASNLLRTAMHLDVSAQDAALAPKRW